MRHEFSKEELQQERKEFQQYDRAEAKQRDRERGSARKVKNALQSSINEAPGGRDGLR